jgi:hypothetical protein
MKYDRRRALREAFEVQMPGRWCPRQDLNLYPVKD